jgi:hypothetical protein
MLETVDVRRETCYQLYETAAWLSSENIIFALLSPLAEGNVKFRGVDIHLDAD